MNVPMLFLFHYCGECLSVLWSQIMNLVEAGSKWKRRQQWIKWFTWKFEWRFQDVDNQYLTVDNQLQPSSYGSNFFQVPFLTVSFTILLLHSWVWEECTWLQTPIARNNTAQDVAPITTLNKTLSSHHTSFLTFSLTSTISVFWFYSKQCQQVCECFCSCSKANWLYINHSLPLWCLWTFKNGFDSFCQG